MSCLARSEGSLGGVEQVQYGVDLNTGKVARRDATRVWQSEVWRIIQKGDATTDSILFAPAYKPAPVPGVSNLRREAIRIRDWENTTVIEFWRYMLTNVMYGTCTILAR